MDNANLDIKRKRHFFLLMNLFMFPVMVFLFVMNYFKGETLDYSIDLMLCLFLMASVFAVVKFDFDLGVYRVSLIVWFAAALYVAAVGSGYGSALYWLLVAPVMLFFFFERNEGKIWVSAFLIISGIIVLYPSLFGTYSYDIYHRIGFSASLLLLTGIGFGIETNRSKYSQLLAEERDNLVGEKRQLQKAMAEIKTLNRMLPICSHCKKIRDDKGYWQQVEAYIHDHSGAEFSHGICPECSRKYYADELKEKKYSG